MGTLILLDGRGPSTGPIAGAPLHPYGRTDASSRFAGDYLGSVGSTVNLWTDVIGGKNFLTPSASTQMLFVGEGAVGGKCVRQPNTVLTGGQRQTLGRYASSLIRTAIIVVKSSAQPAATRRFIQLAGKWRLQRAGNGTFMVADSQTVNRTTPGTDDWTIIAGAADPNAGTLMIKRIGYPEGTVAGASLTGKLGSDYIFSSDTIALDSALQEVLLWDKTLTATECEAVMQTLATHYGIAS